MYYRQEKLKNIQIVDPDRHVKRIMTQMKTDLRMPEEPRHLECFDNSNIQGTNPASAVSSSKWEAIEKDYRKFNIKTVEGPDDLLPWKRLYTEKADACWMKESRFHS